MLVRGPIKSFLRGIVLPEFLSVNGHLIRQLIRIMAILLIYFSQKQLPENTARALCDN